MASPCSPVFAFERLRQIDPEHLVYESLKPGPGGRVSPLMTPLKLIDRLAAQDPAAAPASASLLRCFGAECAAAGGGGGTGRGDVPVLVVARDPCVMVDLCARRSAHGQRQ